MFEIETSVAPERAGGVGAEASDRFPDGRVSPGHGVRGGHWELELTLESRPRWAAAAPWTEVAGSVVAYRDDHPAVIALDPVTSVVWTWFDGTSTIGELSGDLAAETGLNAREAERVLLLVVRVLASQGFIDGFDYGMPGRYRYRSFGPDDCMGKKHALEMSDRMLLPDGYRPLQVGITDGAVSAGFRAWAGETGRRVEAPNPARETEVISLNSAAGTVLGGRPFYRLISHMGEVLASKRDDAAGLGTVIRHVADHQAVSADEAWFRMPVLVRGDNAVLVDRGLAGFIERGHRALAARDIALEDSRYVRIAGGATRPVEIDGTLPVSPDLVERRERLIVSILIAPSSIEPDLMLSPADAVMPSDAVMAARSLATHTPIRSQPALDQVADLAPLLTVYTSDPTVRGFAATLDTLLG